MTVSYTHLDVYKRQPNKRIKVDEYNRVKGYNDVFVLGDLAANDQPLPQVAQVAIQQGKRLAKNLNNAGDIRKWKPFTYHDMGTMATCLLYTSRCV